MSDQQQSEPAVPPPATDPWKGLRGVMAGTLVLEAITVLLALPVVGAVGGGLSWWSVVYLVGLAALMMVGAGMQRRSWALPFNLTLQALVLLGTFVHLSIGVIGVIFAAVWAFILVLRHDVKRRMEQGLLPSQRVAGPSAS
ncbi:DUF4233 domain-containing protein [Nocardia sp. alder85J]|uniref:DUF4233 domain-containing protein n=1 Tax=Nocardia sp. alder85J TaxID=2862949 RepID=UPI001CD6B72F|nr:DUF4233 domain-containing protein [Nocardia sp. alder85J]MCX4097442.1 DUF4233 domain-containing protein [Nocardia sp. alder85J]